MPSEQQSTISINKKKDTMRYSDRNGFVGDKRLDLGLE